MPSIQTLANHLACYGFKNFTSATAYLQWAGQQLGEKKAQTIDRLRRPLAQDEVKPDNVLRFYDYIADPSVAPVVHSMKTDAIRASGEAVCTRIRGRKNILDLGCNIGYLSTWYAQQDDNIVTGVDVSQASIDEAQRRAQDLGCKNIRFLAGDVRKMLYSEYFDAIVDTQTIYTLHKKKQTLVKLYSLLQTDGILVTIPPIRTATKLAAYLELLAQAGFRVRCVEFIAFSILGEPDIHPVIEAGKSLGPQGISIDDALQTMRQTLLQYKMPA